MKTEVKLPRPPFGITKDDAVLVMGSCFATGVGDALKAEGYDVMVNPFGTLFNPASIASSLERLASGKPFCADEAVMMGAGAGLWCSFSHYTRFARPTVEEFLLNANDALASASEFYKRCTKVILTFGTAWVFRHEATGKIVSNCLKIPARDFTRELLSVDDVAAVMDAYSSSCGTFGRSDIAPKQTVYTVSPIRHMADGAHGNTISKATLHLGIEKILSDDDVYFPSFEILIDELRDYSYYAEDLVHPGNETAAMIARRFMEWCCR